MTGLEALEAVQYVNMDNRQFAVIGLTEWEALIEWLETLEDVQIARNAYHELESHGGDREKAGWLRWDDVRDIRMKKILFVLVCLLISILGCSTSTPQVPEPQMIDPQDITCNVIFFGDQVKYDFEEYAYVPRIVNISFGDDRSEVKFPDMSFYIEYRKFGDSDNPMDAIGEERNDLIISIVTLGKEKESRSLRLDEISSSSKIYGINSVITNMFTHYQPYRDESSGKVEYVLQSSFTGFNSVEHPESSSRIEYWCSVQE